MSGHPSFVWFCVEVRTPSDSQRFSSRVFKRSTKLAHIFSHILWRFERRVKPLGYAIRRARELAYGARSSIGQELPRAPPIEKVLHEKTER